MQRSGWIRNWNNVEVEEEFEEFEFELMIWYYYRYLLREWEIGTTTPDGLGESEESQNCLTCVVVVCVMCLIYNWLNYKY